MTAASKAHKARTRAASRYKPKRVRILLVAEAPPRDASRYFYFPDVRSSDWLFRSVVEVLLRKKPGRVGKTRFLQCLKARGVFLIDLKQGPADGTDLTNYVPDLVSRCVRLAPGRVILIKVTVYDAAYAALKIAGVPVVNKRIPFPAFGQQKNFRKLFASAVAGI